MGEYSYFFICIYVYASLHMVLYTECFFFEEFFEELEEKSTSSWISFVLSRASGNSALLRVDSMALDKGGEKGKTVCWLFFFLNVYVQRQLNYVLCLSEVFMA